MGILGDLMQEYPGAVIRTFPRAPVSFVAAATTGTLYQVSTDRRNTAILVTIAISRRAGGNTFFQVGEGDFTVRLPDLPVINGQLETYGITDGTLPIFTFEVDITGQAIAAAAATSDVRVLATVLEF